jgi:hypothetical protein
MWLVGREISNRLLRLRNIRRCLRAISLFHDYEPRRP